MAIENLYDGGAFTNEAGQRQGIAVVKTIAIDPATGSSQSGVPAGRASAANSIPTTQSTEDLAAVLPAKTTTNRSLATSTTAAAAMPANTARRGWKVKNDSAIDVWINFIGTATAVAGSGNLKVAAGAYLASEPGYVETGAMSIIAASGTPAITIYEFS
ncbi:hypothetical protein [Rhizobium rhizogenes]|uniref:hypothetical protein n=1 Tax=Rhizobium rhizogenes TaxID=359 RepID=UPI0022BDA4EE|nr:hypothetical protein [Rhizobium rhizogenes]MCZ7488158.1 hypothetical protein [Rhizobium rhizogenes]